MRSAPAGSPSVGTRGGRAIEAAVINLPAYVPKIAVTGYQSASTGNQPGFNVKQRLEKLSGASLIYQRDDHSILVKGPQQAIQAAAQLVDRNIRQYLLTRPRGAPYRGRDLVNILSDDFQGVEQFSFVPYTRPLLMEAKVAGVLSAASSSLTAEQSKAGSKHTNAGPTSSSGAASSTSTSSGTYPTGSGVHPNSSSSLHTSHRSEQQLLIEEVSHAAVELAHDSPIDYDDVSVTFNLGKTVLIPTWREAQEWPSSTSDGAVLFDRSSVKKRLNPSTADHKGGMRLIFDANLTREAVQGVDRVLLESGLGTAATLSRTVTLQLVSSIPWVQYHMTLELDSNTASSNTLVLKDLTSESFKAATVTVVSGAERLDYRARVLGKGSYPEDDPTAVALRKLAAAGEFMLVDNSQVSLPESLQALDLRLLSARVKVRRVYVGPLPAAARHLAMEAHSRSSNSSNGAGNADAGADVQGAQIEQPTPPPAAAAAAAKKRGRKPKAAATPVSISQASSSSSSSQVAYSEVLASTLLPKECSVEVAVSAVIDSGARKRLEVLAVCPELNSLLLRMHAGQAVLPEGMDGGVADAQREAIARYARAMHGFVRLLQQQAPACLTSEAAPAAATAALAPDPAPTPPPAASPASVPAVAAAGTTGPDRVAAGQAVAPSATEAPAAAKGTTAKAAGSTRAKRASKTAPAARN